MSLDGNCGKSGKTNLIFFGMMPPVGVVLCMPDQFQVFLPLAVIIPAKHIWHACYKALQVFFKDFCPFICPNYLFGGTRPDLAPL